MEEINRTIAGIVDEPYFLHFIIPLLVVFLSVYLKISSKHDRLPTFQKSDFTVGFDIIITAFVIFIMSWVDTYRALKIQYSPQLDAKLTTVPLVLVGFFIVILTVQMIVRKRGWNDDDEVNIFYGIVIPTLFGLSMLWFIVSWMGV